MNRERREEEEEEEDGREKVLNEIEIIIVHVT